MTMHAVRYHRYGGPEELAVARVPRPSPVRGEVRVQVHAVALNPADKFLLAGSPRAVRVVSGLRRPRTGALGGDVAGVVDAVGPGVTNLGIGDEVFGELSGTLAEYVCGSPKYLHPMPARLTFEEAAALPVAGAAALAGLNTGKVTRGTRLLVIGASGGIGTIAVQAARARGAIVTGVCSTRNRDLVESLGANVVDYQTQSLRDLAERFDVILDNVASTSISDLRRLLTPHGMLLTNSGEPGPDGGPLARMITAPLRVLTSRQKAKAFTSRATHGVLQDLAALVGSDALHPVVDGLFTMESIAAAMERVSSRHARGKVVVSVRH